MRSSLRYWCCTIGLAGCAGLVSAAAVDDKRDELRALREQIRSLQQEMARSEESRDEAADVLAESERAISASQRRLRQISAERRAAEAQVQKLQVERQRIEEDLGVLRERLGDTLYRMYVEGGQAGARRILGGSDPNQTARDIYYLEQIGKQRAGDIAEARLALANLQEVLKQAEARKTELARLEIERAREQDRLLAERRKQRAALAEVAGTLRAQRKEIASLQRDQNRLSKLVQGLERIARNQAAKAARQKKSQPPPSEATVGRADIVASEADASETAFANLRGRLRWPVKGELVGRFGTPRAEGGAVWRGVFIRAAVGNEVKAVAGGKVAFADWLRGFGNLLIVDHGAGYMTIYGNNEVLYKNPGDVVKAGDAIATVGATGGAEESGLYFEIRHRGEPNDPLKWVSGR